MFPWRAYNTTYLFSGKSAMHIGRQTFRLLQPMANYSLDPVLVALMLLFLLPCALAVSGLVYLLSGAEGIIPWRVADYVIVLSFCVWLLSSAFGWLLIEGRKNRILAGLATVILSVAWILSYLGFGFISGLPGTEWVKINDLFLFWALSLGSLVLVLGMRTDAVIPFVCCMILALPTVFVGANFLIAMQMRSAISGMDLENICAVQNKRPSNGKYQQVRIFRPSDIQLWPSHRWHQIRIQLFNGDQYQKWIFTKYSFSKPYKYSGKKYSVCFD